MNKKLDYEQVVIAPSNRPQQEVYDGDPRAIQYYPKQPLNPFVSSALAFIAAIGAFASIEKFAPLEYKPSTILGTMDARMESAVADAVKAKELQHQAELEHFNTQLRVYYDAQNNYRRAQLDAVLKNYDALYQRNTVLTQAATAIQNRFAENMMNQTMDLNRTDIAVGSGARALGRLFNAFEPGSGDAMQEYGQDVGRDASQALIEAAQAGTSINIAQYNIDIPTVAQIIADINSIEQPELPQLPNIQSDLDKTKSR